MRKKKRRPRKKERKKERKVADLTLNKALLQMHRIAVYRYRKLAVYTTDFIPFASLTNIGES